MRKILALLLGVACFGQMHAQELPLLETQVFDPYVSNPGMIGIDRYSQINLVYRKQWANVPNAPSTIGVNGQFILSPRITVGGIIMHDRSVILGATTALATFAYQVPLAEDHFFNFGLSGGFYADRLRMDALDNVTDPALYTNEARFLGHAQFGMAYVFKGLRLGFMLPQLLNTYRYGGESTVSFSPLKAKTFSAFYSAALTKDVAVEPFGQYYFDQNNNSFFELGALINYKSVLRIGGFHRQQMGIGVMVQLAPTEKLSVGYSYQGRGSSATAFGGSSHEIQLKVRFGKKWKNSTRVKREPTVEIATEATKPNDAESGTTMAQNTNTVQSTSDYTPPHLITSYSRSDVETTKPDEPPYLVVGCFKSLQNAERLLNSLLPRHPNAGLGYIKSRQMHFVYIQAMGSGDDISVDAIQHVRSTTQFKDAWFMRLQHEK